MAFKKYNNPEELKSKYVHERRDKLEEMEKRDNNLDNHNSMRTNNMDQLTKFWDGIINKMMHR